MKMTEWFVMAVTAFAVAALLMPRNAQTEYETAVVSVRTVEETIEASGVIAPRETFLAAPLTAGKLRLLVEKGEEVAVLVNSLGATTLLELSVVYRKLEQLLKEDGVSVYDCELHNYVTCQEMGGFSITLMRLDQELKKYYSRPCWSPYYAKQELK